MLNINLLILLLPLIPGIEEHQFLSNYLSDYVIRRTVLSIIDKIVLVKMSNYYVRRMENIIAPHPRD